jgi:hypothetical protein
MRASRYEGGGTPEGFVDFQKRIAPQWLRLEKEFGPWKRISPLNSREQTVDEIVNYCLGGTWRTPGLMPSF